MEGQMWNKDLPVVAVRVARPTDQLEKVVQFYTQGLGLQVIGEFKNHAGYDGVMLGLPGEAYHLEFTQHAQGSPCPAPTEDNLLVLYFSDKAAIERLVQRFAALGYPEVAPENPYWIGKSITIADPDGWRLVLFDSSDAG